MNGRLARPVLALLALAMTAAGAIKLEPIPDLKPPRPELPPPTQTMPVWPWVAVALVMLAAGIALVWPRKAIVQTFESPAQRATREFQALAPGSAQAGDVVQTFRRYVATALPVPPGQTPEEMHTFLARHPRWTPEQTARFTRLFDPVELAKFAPAVSPPSAAPLIREALDLVATIEDFRTTVPSLAVEPKPVPTS